MDSGQDTTTPFGRWVSEQPRGVLTRAMQATKLAYSTVHAATKRRMSDEVSRKLSRFTKGEVRVSQIKQPRNRASARAEAAE